MINKTDMLCNRKIMLTNRLVRLCELPLLIESHGSALNHIAVLYEGPFNTNIVYRKCIDSVRRKIFFKYVPNRCRIVLKYFKDQLIHLFNI